MMKYLFSFFSLVSFISAGWSQAKTYNFPNPVDTGDKPIILQTKKTYQFDHLFFDNQFDGARLNEVIQINDTSFQVSSLPENSPINSSPWYAFRSWNTGDKSTIKVTIRYQDEHKHRYWPKISLDGNLWNLLDSSQVAIAKDMLSVTITLNISSDTVWLAAQPLETSSDVKRWCMEIAHKKNYSYHVIGKSREGRELHMLKFGTGKKAVVLLSRQHPPEVTGYYVLKSFVKELTNSSQIQKKFLNEYTILVYPLLNPDGVDLGHWRHNTGGVDLNRDWAYYQQPETRQVANHIVNTVNKDSLEVVLGLDFHSTWYDVYYTTDRQLNTINDSFTDLWLTYIENNLKNYTINEQPSGLMAPVSKGWFITQFNAPGITFEIGDNTPIEFINEKGKVAAKGMMKILLEDKLPP